MKFPLPFQHQNKFKSFEQNIIGVIGITFEKKNPNCKFKSYGRQISGNISHQFKDVYDAKFFNKSCFKIFIIKYMANVLKLKNLF